MSEKTLDKLISSLKTEAIEAAEQEAAGIEEEARQEAAKILADCKAECDKMRAEAETQAQQTIEKGESALQQATRNVTVTLQNDLLKLLGNVLEKEVTNQFQPDAVKRAIGVVLENVGSGVELDLSEDLKKELQGYVRDKLQSSDTLTENNSEGKLLKSITISKKNEGWSYHIDPEAVSAMLKAQLRQNWLEIINKS